MVSRGFDSPYIFSLLNQIKMTNEIVLTLKIKGTFSRDGFTINNSAPLLTIKKFKDGTFSAKLGHKIVKDRFASDKAYLIKCFSQLGINF
jgi:hypothetical protein